MAALPRPWSQIERDIEAEMKALMQDLRSTADPHSYRHVQGQLDGLERAMEIARRQPEQQPSAADDNLYPV
jgi:hypothetical protein